MAIKIRKERQSERFHSMKLLGKGHSHKSGDMNINVIPLVDMMMVLVIFLVMNFNASGEMLFLSKDIKMATAENGDTVTRVPIIAISNKSQLYFEGVILTDMNNIDPNDPNWRIAELEEKLADNRQRVEAIGKREWASPDEDPTTTVNVQADMGTDFKVLKRVLYTCEQAGYGRIRLAVGDARRAGEGASGLEPVEGGAAPPKE
ncbi:MAG: biopolymer transporter ExbD [Deltaproteobacteria bacterium]|nr:biopolymer transporter ExbD [Deltaproteobacteria bacterium]